MVQSQSSIFLVLATIFLILIPCGSYMDIASNVGKAMTELYQSHYNSIDHQLPQTSKNQDNGMLFRDVDYSDTSSNDHYDIGSSIPLHHVKPVMNVKQQHVRPSSVVTLPSAAVLPYPTYYFYFSQSIPTDEPRGGGSTINERNITELENVDDSPFGHYRLPWPIVLFNRRIHDLFINANGAIHLSKTQPCRRDNFFLFERYGCTLNKSYEGVVAAFLTDLSFHNCPLPAKVVTYNTTYTATIAYRSVCYYGTKIDNHFRITFDRRDHHIEVAYDRIRKNFLLPFRDYTVAGLRGFINDSSATSTSLVTTEEDNQRGVLMWRTTVPGIYPRFDEVVTGKKVMYCPVTLQFCLENETISINWSSIRSSSSSIVQTVTLSTLVLSCQAYVDYYLVVSLHKTNYKDIDMVNAKYVTFPCQTNQSKTMTWNSDSAIHNHMYCQFNLTALGNMLEFHNVSSENTTIHLFPGWALHNTTAAVFSISILPMESIDMVLINTTMNSSASYLTDMNGGNSLSTCQDTALCTGNYSCLGLECYQASDLESIYSLKTCTDECPEASAYGSYDSNHVRDEYGHCCTIGDLDCGGFCFGNYSVTLNEAGATYCCSAEKVIDCKGICEGKTEYDACGVCGGTDFTGQSCFNFSLISVSSRYSDQNALYPAFNIPAGFDPYVFVADYPEMHSSEDIVIDNKSNSSFVVTLTVLDDYLGVDPVLNYSMNSKVVEAQSSVSLSLDVSLVAMLQGIHKTWIIKHVQVTYYRSVYPSAKFTKIFPIYPTVYGCKVLNRGRCMLMPGCIFCQTFPKMLLVNNHANRYLMFPDDDGVNNTLIASGRRLFNNFLPIRYRSSLVDVTGVCIDGWLSDDCSVNKDAHIALANGVARSSIVPILCSLSVLLSVVTIFFIETI